MADHSAEIARIESILRRGVTTVTVDGTTMTYDFAELRRQLDRLRQLDDATRGKRPFAATIRLDGAM